MKWPRRKKGITDEIVIKKSKKVTITERRNGTRITEELTSDFVIRPPRRIGWPLIFLIIFLAVLLLALVVGYFVVGFEGIYELLKGLLERLIEQISR